MTFKIITLGCKVNAYESEIMKEQLENAGYQNVTQNSDITIINTCSVTNMADKKSFKIVRNIKKENPNTLLVVAGCSSENKQEKYKELDIDILLGNKDKSKIVEFIKEYQKKKEPIVKFYPTRKLSFEDMTVEKFKSHTRAFIKVQDGCDNFCSYCIIPYVRGSIRSKDFKTSIEEAKVLSKNHSEIVLTGIHTGSYKSKDNQDLTDLIHEMSKIDSLKRIRISSIEITELNEKFLKELQENPKICDHLHIPIQSGSDKILKIMNRKYDVKAFEEKMKQIRQIRPNISITTDCIVGHPYETEENFKETLQTIERIQFSKVHAFPYSKREGTTSARMPQLEESVKKNRNRMLIALSKKLEEQYAKKFLNQELEVLIEEENQEFSVGHTSNYLKVQINQKLKTNTYYPIIIKEVKEDRVIGELSQRPKEL